MDLRQVLGKEQYLKIGGIIWSTDVCEIILYHGEGRLNRKERALTFQHRRIGT